MKKIFAFLISISIILFVLLYSIDFMAKDISYYNNFHRDYKIEKESGNMPVLLAVDQGTGDHMAQL